MMDSAEIEEATGPIVTEITIDSESFERRREALKGLLSLQKSRLDETYGSRAKKIENFKTSISDPIMLEGAISLLDKSLIHKRLALEKTRLILDYLRQRNPVDMTERIWADNNFSTEVRKNCPRNLPLRFQGAPIYFSKQIIETGGISSSVDRLGVETSYDISDQISVTTPESLETTVHGYLDLTAQDGHLPAGCMFVMLPASAEDENAGKSMLMGNIDFKERTGALLGVVTSEENKRMVETWMNNSGLDKNIVYSFREFPSKLKELKDKIDANPNLLKELLPYK